MKKLQLILNHTITLEHNLEYQNILSPFLGFSAPFLIIDYNFRGCVTKNILNLLFKHHVFTKGVPKRFLVGKMDIKGGVVLITFLSKMRRFAEKRLFLISKSIFDEKVTYKAF